MILCRIFDKILLISMQTLMKLFFFVLISETLMLPCCFVDDSLISFEETFWNIDKFDGNFSDLYCFCCVNLWITDVSLLLRRWFVDDSLMIHIWNFDNFDGIFSIFIVFALLRSESLMFHCYFSDNSLMILLRNIDDTTKIWM